MIAITTSDILLEAAEACAIRVKESIEAMGRETGVSPLEAPTAVHLYAQAAKVFASAAMDATTLHETRSRWRD